MLRNLAISVLRAVDRGKGVRVKRKMLRASLVPDFLLKALFGE
jgi:hypothetical protein